MSTAEGRVDGVALQVRDQRQLGLKLIARIGSSADRIDADEIKPNQAANRRPRPGFGFGLLIAGDDVAIQSRPTTGDGPCDGQGGKWSPGSRPGQESVLAQT